MRDDVLERKIARIIMDVSKALDVSEERALDLFYSTDTYRQLVDGSTGLQLMSDGYVLEDALKELGGKDARNAQQGVVPGN